MKSTKRYAWIGLYEDGQVSTLPNGLLPRARSEAPSLVHKASTDSDIQTESGSNVRIYKEYAISNSGETFFFNKNCPC